MSLSKKYNLILMSDDNSTRRFRMSKRTLQIILICLILIPILLIFSSMLAVQSIQKEQNMRMSFNSQQRELVELRSKVERLNNLNTLLEKYDSTYLAQNEQPKTSKEDNSKPKKELALATNTNNGNQAASQEEPINGKEDKKNLLENELKNQNNQESVPLTEFEDNGNSSDNMDMNLAKIEKLKVKPLGNNNLQISFDLINTGQKNQLEGNVQFFLLDKAGSKLALTASARSLSYRINKLKKVVVDAKYDAGDIKPQEHILIIEINNMPEGIIYREQVVLITE